MTFSKRPAAMRAVLGACAAAALALGLSGCDRQPEAEADANRAASQAAANKVAPSSAAKEDSASPSAAGRILYLAPNGLAAGERGLHASNLYAFGLPREQAIAPVSAILGRPTATQRNETCSSGPMEIVRWGGFGMNFRGGRFVGWSQQGPAATPPLQTELEVGIGSRRDELNPNDGPEPVVRRTSRGLAFDVDGLEGLLSGPGAAARVTLLHAGQNCFPPRSGALG